MARVYTAKEIGKVAGLKKSNVEEIAAHHKDTQRGLTKLSARVGGDARALLARHRDAGHARIVNLEGRVDRTVVLDDTRGMKAALSIEFGRKPSERDKGMEGLFVLTRAMGAAKGWKP